MTSLSPNSNLPILTTNEYLAIPAPSKRPIFEEIAGIALASALGCKQSVCVLCLTQEVLKRWALRLEEFF